MIFLHDDDNSECASRYYYHRGEFKPEIDIYNVMRYDMRRKEI